jgi:hypothetical protein
LSDPSSLPAKAVDILRSLGDRSFAAMVERVFEAAAVAVDKLAGVDLISYDAIIEDSTADLSLWEALAPVVRDTVLDVNGFLNVSREEVGDAGSEDDEPLATPPPTERAVSIIRETTRKLAGQITELGERVRMPEIVADRWALLAEVQAFRTRFRDQLGGLVFDVLSLFTEVERSEVVPGFDSELNAAITVRSTVTDLRRLLAVRQKKVQEALPDDVGKLGRELVGEMDAFGKTEAFKLLRAQDKRQVIELRASLKEIIERPHLEQPQLLAVVDGYLEFTESLTRINNREFLIAHDRQIWASLGVELEQADQLRSKDLRQSAERLYAAISRAQVLYGRDLILDTFLRRTKRMSVPNLDARELKAELDKFRELLANIPMY